MDSYQPDVYQPFDEMPNSRASVITVNRLFSIPEFNGNDPQAWLSRAISYFEKNPMDTKDEWDTFENVKYVYYFMTGPAEIWFVETFTTQPKENWECFCEKMLRHFTNASEKTVEPLHSSPCVLHFLSPYQPQMTRWDEILSLLVQNPPTLEFSSADLVWSKVESYCDNMDRLVLIPFARVADFLKGGDVRHSRTTYVPKNKSAGAGRPNKKRGCTCHFIGKRLIAEPSVALVIYNQDKHVDKNGLLCHGPQGKKAAGTRATYAPYISEELRLRILSLLHEGSIRRSTYDIDENDVVSVNMWIKNQQSNVFFYEDFSDSDPIVLDIQCEWQLQQMISLVVFNSDNKAIPVTWIITSRFASKDTHRWMRALYDRVCAKDPSWKLAGIVDPLTDVLAIREVFQCSVSICFWSVSHAWHKNLIKRCSKMETRVVVSKSFSQAVDKICKDSTIVYGLEELMEKFRDAVELIDYFKEVWFPRLGSWTSVLKTFPLASQEKCATSRDGKKIRSDGYPI